MNKLVILGLLAASAIAVPMPGTANVQLNRNLDCFEQDDALFSCVFVKTVNALNRAARSSDIDIIDGVKFVREIPSEYRLRLFKLAVLHLSWTAGSWILGEVKLPAGLRRYSMIWCI